MDNQRLILFVALAAIIFMIWQAWVAQTQPPQPVPSQEEQLDKDKSVPRAPKAPDTATPTATPAPVVLPQGQRIHVTTDLVDAWIDTAGGDLRELHLRKYPVTIEQPDEPFRLITEFAEDMFIAQSGLIGRDRQYPNHNTLYSTTATRYALAPEADHIEVKLGWIAPDGVRYTKTYTFRRNSYLIDLRFRVENPSNSPWEGYLYGQFRRQHTEEKRGLFMLPTYTGGILYTPENQFEKITFDDVAENDLKRVAQGGWVGMMRHYFVGSWLPEASTRNQFYGDAPPTGIYTIGYKNLAPTAVPSGGVGELSTQLYIGPKEQARLKDLPKGMDLTVDFGWLTFISAPLFWVLAWIHGWIGNWGWAIIILTILIKLAFFPLSAASYKSMAHMRRVQPKLKSIKERYGDDKQRYQQAMMEIYKTEKINPLGGCLPILVQIPVFIALYWALLESVEMRHAPFALWITDLSSPDPYFVLPLLMGVTMFAQTHLNPAPMDPMQKKIMTFMPILFTAFFLFFPAGLVLYWVVNNLLSIAQQWQITRIIEAKAK